MFFKGTMCYRIIPQRSRVLHYQILPSRPCTSRAIYISGTQRLILLQECRLQSNRSMVIVQQIGPAALIFLLLGGDSAGFEVIYPSDFSIKNSQWSLHASHAWSKEGHYNAHIPRVASQRPPRLLESLSVSLPASMCAVLQIWHHFHVCISFG